MSGRTFRPTLSRATNSMKILSSTKTNATIRDLEEEEGELEEKEGTVVSIKRDAINGTGWTVKDAEGNTYICSCASSMYEVPESVERGGVLYPTDTVEVVFTINPVLRINTIKEIKSLGEETEKLDISQWTHGESSTTVIAKPKSAVSISDGFIELNYDNDNSVLADPDAVKTEGKETQINTDKLSINSPEVQIQGQSIYDMIGSVNPNTFNTYMLDSLEGLDIVVNSINSMTQVDIPADIRNSTVVGEIKDQLSTPLKEQQQQLMTDGNCVDILRITEDGIISIEFESDSTGQRRCPESKTISGIYNFISSSAVYRNYIKVTVKQTCNNCHEGNNTLMEYINYCPSCQNWNTLVDTSTSIKCTSCNSTYCQNCGHSHQSNHQLKKYVSNYIISSIGTTCDYCKSQLSPGTAKIYVNYCPDCKKFGFLYASEILQKDEIVNILKCGNCLSEYCCSCGINQEKHGLTLSDNPVQFTDYKNALRKLKYIRDA